MLAPLWEQARIRVNCLVPDWVATEEVQAYVDSLTAEQREADGVPKKLTSLAEVGEAVERLVTDETLFGRVLVWWSGEEPRFIPWADPGYAALEG
jgi:NAD(P)-dependent dehydrogenase (short-subunit alcohol dehydrogenase family)